MRTLLILTALSASTMLTAVCPYQGDRQDRYSRDDRYYRDDRNYRQDRDQRYGYEARDYDDQNFQDQGRFGRETRFGRNTDNFTSNEDMRLGQRIRDRIHPDQDISLTINNGDVTIQGTVRSQDEKTRIERDIQNIAGVRNVNNELNVGEFQQQQRARY